MSKAKRPTTIVKTPVILRARNPPPESHHDAITIGYIRFMDDYFGAGAWEPKAGEPADNKILRVLARSAFFAGAGEDYD